MFKDQGHQMTTFWQISVLKSHTHNITKNATNTVFDVMTKFAHHKGGFGGPMCDLGILSQPAEVSQSMLQHQVLISFF